MGGARHIVMDFAVADGHDALVGIVDAAADLTSGVAGGPEGGRGRARAEQSQQAVTLWWISLPVTVV